MRRIVSRSRARIRDVARRLSARGGCKEKGPPNAHWRVAIAVLAFVTGIAPAAAQTPSARPAAAAARGDNYVFDTLEFKESRVLDAIRVISDQSGANIVATSEAGKRTVSLFLRRSSVKQTVEAIARVSGLWYNYNKTNNVYMLMTVKEYQDDLVVFRQNYARSFTLQHQNVVDTARVIKALFGDRVSLTVGNDDALRDFQREIGSGSISGSGSGFGNGAGGSRIGGGFGSSSNISNTQTRRSQFDVQQTTQQQTTTRSADSQQRPMSQLTPGQLSLLQELAAPGEGGESGAAPQISGSSLATVRNRDTTIYVAVNRLHNILYVRSSDEAAIDQIARIVADSDRPTPQVLLEMKVLELTVGDDFGSLFDIGVSSGGTHTITNPDGTVTTAPSVTAGSTFKDLGSPTLLFQVVSNSIRARLQLMENHNRVKVIATPMVTATNTTPAQLFIGEERVIVTGFSQNTIVGSTGASSTSFTAQTEQRDIGTTLRIIPRINSDRTVTLLVQSDDSTVNVGGGTLPVSAANGTVQNLAVDTVSTSNIQGVVTAKDGLTVAMGGLIRKQSTRNTDKVPVLGDIPGVGFFFKRIENNDTRSELVVLITPHVFFTPAKADSVSRERTASVSAHPDLSSEGFAASNQARDGGVEALVTLARATRLAEGGADALGLGLIPITLPTDPSVQLLPNAALQIVPHAAWRQGQLYATTVTIQNMSNRPAQLNPRQVVGRWKAVSFDRPVLEAAGSPQSKTTGYFFSDRPFSQVMALLTSGSAR